ncbi:MAG: hypothetical protein AB7F96_12005 [Beijerinckiaceae bacterium]
MPKKFWPAALCGLSLLALPVTASAQYFKDKTITMIINYGAGGNADTEGRIFQRHLSKHIAGKPTIVVNNIPGAGGMTAVNRMGLGIGVRDPSLTMGFFTFNLIAPLIEDPALQVKMDVFETVGGVGQYSVTYAVKSKLPGKQQPADIAKAKGIYAAGYSRSSSHDIRVRLMLDVMGPEYKVVTGFRSVGAVNQAMLQGEINFMLSTIPGYQTQVIPNLINTGVAIPMWQVGALGPDGKMIGSPALTKAGVPFFEDVYKQAYGKLPDSPKYKALALTADANIRLARMVLMPKKADPQALAELRKAFLALREDKDFASEYNRIIKSEPSLVSGEDANAILSKMLKETPDEIRKVLKQAAGVK